MVTLYISLARRAVCPGGLNFSNRPIGQETRSMAFTSPNYAFSWPSAECSLTRRERGNSCLAEYQRISRRAKIQPAP